MHAIALTPAGTIIAPSELIVNPDGSIYHLALRPDQLGDLVFVVGDQGRVELISRISRRSNTGCRTASSWPIPVSTTERTSPRSAPASVPTTSTSW